LHGRSPLNPARLPELQLAQVCQLSILLPECLGKTAAPPAL
jgi:hypothetical protein